MSAPHSSPSPSLASLQALVREDLLRVDEVIVQHSDSSVPLIPQLARHIVAAGGKRLRPALTLLAARLCGYQGERHVRLAACVEFIHTATLLHDDVVDESALRRGTPTANDIWGNQASVLVGDFLFSRAFQLMVADGALDVLKILSDASATIAEGEVMQLETANNLATTQAQYLQVVRAKTSALFAAACELGAIVSEEARYQEPLRTYGDALGVAFQIMDDTLDYAADQAQFGKTVGDDFREGKITLPVILAYAKADAGERDFWHRTLEHQEQTDDDFPHACRLIAKHQALAEAIRLAHIYGDTAIQALHSFPACAEKNALLETIAFCTQRSY